MQAEKQHVASLHELYRKLRTWKEACLGAYIRVRTHEDVSIMERLLSPYIVPCVDMIHDNHHGYGHDHETGKQVLTTVLDHMCHLW